MSKIPLSSLLGKDLSRIAAHTGLRSSGTKTHLASRLPQDLGRQLFGNGKQRILSVDMGLRNLAFCLVEVDLDHFTVPGGSSAARMAGTSDMGKSKRKTGIDSSGFVETLFSENNARVNILEAVRLCKWEHTDLVQGTIEADELYDPPTLAPVVYNLVKHKLLPLNPDHVIIERQRHRSGGQAAILEWTFRVNMLESMLWSSLETLRLDTQTSRDKSLQTHAVLPARVNTLLLNDGDRKTSEAKVLKTAMAEGWLRSGTLICETEQAEQMKAEFLIAYKKGSKAVSRKQVKAASKAGILTDKIAQVHEAEQEYKQPLLQAKKLDDLADCLLQAIAWVQWEANRRNIVTKLAVNN